MIKAKRNLRYFGRRNCKKQTNHSLYLKSEKHHNFAHCTASERHGFVPVLVLKFKRNLPLIVQGEKT